VLDEEGLHLRGRRYGCRGRGESGVSLCFGVSGLIGPELPVRIERVDEATIVGRGVELGELRSFLTARSGALLVEGEPGIGKTTIWRAAVAAAAADGYRVLASRPAEAEAKLSFSALADLVEPIAAEGLAALPDPQRRALEVALLRTAPGDSPPDVRAVAFAFRSLLSEAAQERPLLVAIDDAQWLDPPSETAIGFALRRISGPVALLATRRPTDALAAVAEGKPPLRLGPLSVGAIHHVIRHELGEQLPRPLLTRVHATAGGNPFFALQLARVALASPRGPRAPLPVPGNLSELVLERIERLPSETREVLITAAAAATPSRSLLARIHGSVDGALEEAEEAGIVETDDRLVRFAHPLYAAAVYAFTTHARRRRVHARLAAVISEPEEQARHLALAATPPDEATAQRVHAAARDVAARGAHAAAADLLEQAIALSDPASDVADARLIDLGQYLHVSGDSLRAIDVLRRVETWADEPPDTQIRGYWTLTEAVYWTGGGEESAILGEQLLRGADAPAVRAALHAKIAAHREFDMPGALEHAEAALALLDELGDEPDPAVLALALGMRARSLLALGRGLDRDGIERAIELDETGEIAQSYGQWLKYVDDFDGARRWLVRTLCERTEAGDDVALPNVFQQLALTECWAGDLALAAEYADRACEIALEMEITPVGPLRIRAIVEAHRGNEANVRADERRIREDGWTGWITQQLEIALGLLELSLGNLDAAEPHLRDALRMAAEMGQLEPGVHRVHGDAAEVVLARGDREQAVAIAALLDEHGRRTEHAWSTAVAARTRALIHAADGDLDGALTAIDEALAAHERLPMPYEHARTLLAWGEIARRARRRREARDALERAREIFDEVGAKLWAARAAAELRRVPIRRGAPEDLTATEARVAELAAQGLTNKEVAQALFLSPKTVEANLARVYRKLGIHSRAELGATMTSKPPG
jgi:DNA-binding CsgD family transcriptional regulator